MTNFVKLMLWTLTVELTIICLRVLNALTKSGTQVPLLLWSTKKMYVYVLTRTHKDEIEAMDPEQIPDAILYGCVSVHSTEIGAKTAADCEAANYNGRLFTWTKMSNDAWEATLNDGEHVFCVRRMQVC